MPLGTEALALLEQLAAVRLGDVLLPGKISGRPLSPAGLRAVMRAMRPGMTIHGLRSGFRDWCGNHQVPHTEAEFCLAHVEGSETVRAYLRDDLLEPRRRVMERWGQFLGGRPTAVAKRSLFPRLWRTLSPRRRRRWPMRSSACPTSRHRKNCGRCRMWETRSSPLQAYDRPNHKPRFQENGRTLATKQISGSPRSMICDGRPGSPAWSARQAVDAIKAACTRTGTGCLISRIARSAVCGHVSAPGPDPEWTGKEHKNGG